MKKQILLLLLLSLYGLSVLGQTPQPSDTTYLFRFVPAKDMFFVPWKNNGATLDSLLRTIDSFRPAIEAGQVYLGVSSYGATGKLAYTRNLRIKSELITRGGLKEENFVTTHRTPTSYKGMRNVVTVTIPASVQKVAAIAGAEVAQKVEAYFAELKANSSEAKQAAAEAQRCAALRTEEERAAEAKRLAAQREAEAKGQQVNEQQATDEILRKSESERQVALTATENGKSDYRIALRANLLRWATLTPDLGIEWHINKNWGVQVNGTWTSWSRDNKNRRYALWEVSPEVRYYIGKEKRGYLGAMYHVGEFNYKLGDTGKQGDLMGGGITGGYRLELNRALALDFSLGFGYTHAEYDKYIVTDDIRVRQGSASKNYWGINQLGITLVWKLVK